MTPSPQKNPDATLPIGIFDSGVGGLTVLAALRKRLPCEDYYYLGDTARLPYGTKSSSTIIRYSVQTTEQLVRRHIKLLVVACNTATAAALPVLQKMYAPLPVIGVIDAGAQAACKAVGMKPDKGNIVIMATESTIRGAAYTKAINAILPGATVTGIPCSLFVSLAEEGWMTGEIAEAIARRYLAPVLANNEKPDCIVLGCTHFPPLAPAIASVAGEDVIMVDSAATTAEVVEQKLRALHLLNPAGTEGASSPDARPGTMHFLTTDAPERFARVGSLFLGSPIQKDNLELVSL